MATKKQIQEIIEVALEENWVTDSSQVAEDIVSRLEFELDLFDEDEEVEEV